MYSRSRSTIVERSVSVRSILGTAQYAELDRQLSGVNGNRLPAMVLLISAVTAACSSSVTSGLDMTQICHPSIRAGNG